MDAVACCCDRCQAAQNLRTLRLTLGNWGLVPAGSPEWRRFAGTGCGLETSVEPHPVGFRSRPFPEIDASWQNGFPESQYDLEAWPSEIAVVLALETSTKAASLVAYH